MINVIFNQFNYEISNKKAEIFEKYNKIIQWGRRNPVKFMEFFFNLEFTDHQKYILLSTWYTKTAVWLMSRNSGKAASLDTPVYLKAINKREKYIQKTIGDLQVGDFIYDEKGELTEVIHLNPIIFDDVFEVEFEDGEKIECNAEHLWNFFFWDENEKIQEKTLDTQSWIKTKFSSLYCKSYNFDYNSVFLKEVKRIEKKKDINGNYVKKPMRCITVSNDSGLFLCGEHATVTHNSYLSSPYIMARSILIPNHKTFILCPAGNQAQETFGKMEDLAKGQIASVTGATSVFWDELKRSTGTSDGFVHDKISHHCELYNGSEVRTVNSVPKNIVGIRSNLNGRKCLRIW